jgi:hypothetical protein
MPELENQADQGQPASPANSGAAAPSSNENPTGGEAPAKPAGEAPAAPEKVYAGKYKTVDDLEKGYKETSKYAREQAALAKSLEAQIPKAPEKYSFDFSAVKGLEGVKLDETDPDMVGMIPIFKELNLSQDQASRLVAAHLQNMASLTPTAEQIKEGLGVNADAILSRWQAAVYKMPIEDQKIAQALSDTPEGIDFLYRYMVGTELPTPPQGGSSGAAPKSAAELKSEAFKYKADNSRSIGFDKGQQDQYAKLMKIALTAEENEKKNKK